MDRRGEKHADIMRGAEGKKNVLEEKMRKERYRPLPAEQEMTTYCGGGKRRDLLHERGGEGELS